MKTFRETALLLSAALFLTACDKEAVQETGPSGSVSGRKVEMTFGLSASGMTSPAAFIPVTAKAAGADEALVLETGAQEPLTRGASLSGDEEGKLHGLWVLQFDNTTSAGKLVLREYHAAGEIQNDKLSVALYDAAATKVYFVANVADDKFSSLPLNTTTLGAFETSVLDFADEAAAGSSGNGLPMAGVYEGAASAATADISLRRMVAKISFTCKVDLAMSSESFVLKKIGLKSVSNRTSYKDQTVPGGTTGLYPAAEAGNFADYAEVDVTAQGSDPTAMATTGVTQVWYVPENLRGVVAGLTEKQKGSRNAPEYSTFIEMSGDYTQGGETFEVTYRIYPGENASTDFNVVRNYRYAIATTIKGINENDSRVMVNKGEDLDKDGETANCYLAHKAGTVYKFDATVKGNGAVTAAYNANGQNAPAIDGTQTLSPVSAKVLWETGSKGSVIADGSLKVDNKGYVYFTTAGDKGSDIAEGNALIGVFSGADGSGTLLWSWHVWATRYDPETDNDTYVTWALAASGSGNGSIVTTSSRSYTVMRFNLGADASSAEGTVGRYGLLYQWGRKDPFVGAAALNSTGTSYAATSNATGYEWKNRKNSEAVAAATADASIGYAVQHPTEFLFYSGSPYDWLNVSADSDQRDNLWGNPNTAVTRPNASQGSKSIYDPCPPGWRVAPQDTWTAFAKNGTGGSSQQNVYPDTFSAGHSFYYDANDASSGKTAFFPAAGLRSGNSGELANTSSYGYYWSSSPNYGGDGSAGYLSFYSGSVYPLNNNNRALGFSVRCVQGK